MDLLKTIYNLFREICHKPIQMTLPWVFKEKQEAFGTFWSNLHLAISGEAWKVLEKPKDVHAFLHKNERQIKYVGNSKAFQSSLIHTLCIILLF